MSGWESNEIEHTFSTGRRMVIRRSLSMQWLIMRSIRDGDPELAAGLSEWFENGTIQVAVEPDAEAKAEEEAAEEAVSVSLAKLQVAARVEEAVVEAMFIRPRVYWDPEEMPPGGGAPDGEIPHHILGADLHDPELSEILEIAFKGVADAARFRDDTAGADGGKDRAGVGKKPKPRARASTRKR